MKIVFMGTPDFAAVSLCRLLSEAGKKAGFEVAAVITQADKPRGRGHRLAPTPVKKVALEYGIPVYQPDTLRKNDEFYEMLSALNPDVMVVVAYGKILPERFLKLPRFGAVNIHASLLPKYRGAGPIQWAVIEGESVTGVTSMQMKKGIDTGDMLVKKELSIGQEETAGELWDRLAELGAEVLEETLLKLEDGTLVPQPQEEAAATYAPMLTKETGKIDWSKSAQEIHNLVRGTNPWPCAWTLYQGETVKIRRTALCPDKQPSKAAPGEILCLVKGKGMLVQTGDGYLYVTEAQFPNAKPMSIDAYALGHTIEAGTVLKGE
jgi:methionyl-tRNA formyltransferase